VWLVDDVVASGATVRACAEVLRSSGAAEVSVLALSRADREPGGSREA
jgi:predicted amidophosphoribosyltransferase